MKPDLGKVSELFKVTRQALNLSQVEFAKMFGTTQSNISHIEAGKNNPRGDMTLAVVEKYLFIEGILKQKFFFD